MTTPNIEPKTTDCPECSGAGTIECFECGTPDALDCDNCDGTGEVDNPDA